jgi:DNA-binding CsgD family transcriptional regulator
MTNIIPVEKISFSNHLFVTSAQDVITIAKPLIKFGITHFAYQKLHKDGSVELLGTHAGFTEKFIKEKLYQNTFVGDVDKYISCYALWRDINCPEITALAGGGFNIGNGLIITKRSENFCEFFYFASTPENHQINSFYINNIDSLEKFIIFFKESAKSILNTGKQQRILYPAPGDTTLLISSDWKNKITPIKSTEIKLSNYIENESLDTPLTDRELECALFLKTGSSAKETAKLLAISPRTVEKHTDNIKEKLKCKTKLQLIATLQNHFITS